MLEAFEVIKNPSVAAHLEAVLSFEQRQKSRYKTTTTSGQALSWFIPRGVILLDGDYLQCRTGELVRVVAAAETVSQVEHKDQLLLTRAAYHLGNRHVPLQIGAGFLRYQHDHVLDAMVVGLGLQVVCQQLPFQPENGAYHAQGEHSHHHSHSVDSHGGIHHSVSSHSYSADGRSHAHSHSSGGQAHASASSHSHSSTPGKP